MSHYVTLPSNGSDLQTKMGIRNNTQADFAIDLKTPFVFPYKAYEVGLVEMSYKNNWIVDIGKFTLSDHVWTAYKIFQLKLNLSIPLFFN